MKTSIALLALFYAPARADVWLHADAPLAFATSAAQDGVFRPGLMPGGGVYLGGSHVAAGLRVRAGFLRDGAAPPAEREDPNNGGLASTTLAARARVGGLWFEIAGGIGLTGETFAPTYELAAGWSFAAESYELGPTARYVHVVSTDEMDYFGTAELVLIGLDVRFGKRSQPRPRRPVATVAKPLPVSVLPTVAPVVAIDRDDDPVRDGLASCATDLEGCPLPEGIEVKDDRIILDERVLFDFDRARVRRAGRRLVRAIVELWQSNPTWARITIEGHADVRGSDEYNLELSDKRARRVRDVMIDLGSDASAIDAIGYGRTRPRDDGASDGAHQNNRRVEFVIERRKP